MRPTLPARVGRCSPTRVINSRSYSNEPVLLGIASSSFLLRCINENSLPKFLAELC